jgi:hypothetical protein
MLGRLLAAGRLEGDRDIRRVVVVVVEVEAARDRTAAKLPLRIQVRLRDQESPLLQRAFSFVICFLNLRGNFLRV